MAEKNSRWMIWMAGLLFTVAFGFVDTTATYVISNDKESRQRDTTLGDKIEKVNEHHNGQMAKHLEQANSQYQQMMVQLAEISTDLKYIKQNGRPN